PFSVLIRGCSFMIAYEAGVLAALWNQAPAMLKSASKIYGASSGAIIATIALCECDLGKGYALPPLLYEMKQDFYKFVENSFCSFVLGRRPIKTLREVLNKHLPPNAHQLVSGKLNVIVTRVRDCRSVVVSDFTSKEDLIQAILCSCYIPLYFGLLPLVYRGVRYIDGEIGMWRASFVTPSTITISSFAGEYDICPKEDPAAFFTFQISDCILQLSKRNLCRLMHI
ncbi:PLPL1 protein, partial [Galbula dea]|nr:PLPL1 protein [Galbula dea]